MRNAFAAEMTTLAANNPGIILLSGDIGNRLFNPYKDKYPDRFFNCGVAEANMTGIAAGMAMCGLRPVTYTITSFNTLRCLEQIKIDICYHNLPVVITGAGAGLSYAELGATHHSCEDIGILRTLPNLKIICPGDAVEVRLALRAAMVQDNPVYLRLGKKNEPVVHGTEPVFKIGKGITVREGRDVCLVSTGNILPLAVETALLLEKQGLSTRVVSMHTVKPLDLSLLAEVFGVCRAVVTLEEHGLIGGLGSAVGDWLASGARYSAAFRPIGLSDHFISKSGGQENARKQSGLDPDNISKVVKALL